MKDAQLFTLFKNKGSRKDCKNYQAISLLSLVSKLYGRIILSRLQVLADRVYPGSQSGFIKNRLSIDMVFTLRLLQEKFIEQNKPLYIMFINLRKVFDIVSRTGLHKVPEKINCLLKLLQMIHAFHNGMTARVIFDGDISEPFNLRYVVKQGCVMGPTLFGVYLSTPLHHASGNLFNLAHLRAKVKTHTVLIHELMFANDMVFSHTVCLKCRVCNTSVLHVICLPKNKHGEDGHTSYKWPTTMNLNQWQVTHDSQPVLLLRLYNSQDSNTQYQGIQLNW